MSNDKEPNESYLGRSSFEYKNSKEPDKNVKVLMCDQEVEGQIAPGYFIISKPANPKDYENMEDEKIGRGKVMVFVPEQCLERMAYHLDIVRKKRHELQQQEAMKGRKVPVSSRSHLQE